MLYLEIRIASSSTIYSKQSNWFNIVSKITGSRTEAMRRMSRKNEAIHVCRVRVSMLILILSLFFLRFYPTFLKNCGRCQSHGMATYLKNVIGCKQVHAPCTKFLLPKKKCFMKKFHGCYKTVIKLRQG